MKIRVVPYSADYVLGVKKFNERLASAGRPYHFAEVARASADSTSRAEQYLAIDENDVVRGGYFLRLENFESQHGSGIAGFYYSPLSEGISDPKYKMVGVLLLLDCLQRQPFLYCLGIGGFGESLAVMLRHAGWRVQQIPFYFRVIRPQAFLQNIEYLRSRRSYKLALDIIRLSGIGYVGLKPWSLVASALRSVKTRASETTCREVAMFEDWADTLWKVASRKYDFVIWRTRDALQRLYPLHDQRFIRILIERKRTAVGWAVMMATSMKGHKQFGNMRVGSLVDMFALDGFESVVVDHATGFLERRNVDLIVSNQSHSSWTSALAKAGYWKGPSNFVFATSKLLTERIHNLENCHINRGDGDGPINL